MDSHDRLHKPGERDFPGMGMPAHRMALRLAKSAKVMADRMRFLKRMEGGRKEIDALWEMIINEGMEKGRADVQVEIACRMFDKGRDEKDISECLGLTVEEIRKAVSVTER